MSRVHSRAVQYKTKIGQGYRLAKDLEAPTKPPEEKPLFTVPKQPKYLTLDYAQIRSVSAFGSFLGRCIEDRIRRMTADSPGIPKTTSRVISGDSNRGFLLRGTIGRHQELERRGHRLTGRKLSLLIHSPPSMKVPYRRRKDFCRRAVVLG